MSVISTIPERFVAVATDDLARIRKMVREQGLSPHSPRGQALMEQLIANPKTKPGQPEVTPDLAKLQSDRVRQGDLLKALKNDIKKLESRAVLDENSQLRLGALKQQLVYEELRYKGFETSIRRLRKIQTK